MFVDFVDSPRFYPKSEKGDYVIVVDLDHTLVYCQPYRPDDSFISNTTNNFVTV